MPCKDRQAEARAYYERHRDEILAKRAEHRRSGAAAISAKARRRENFERAGRIKEERGCMDCRGMFPYYALDFDHRGEKLCNIAKLIGNTRSWAVIQREIDGCDVVCATCHRLRTHKDKPRLT